MALCATCNQPRSLRTSLVEPTASSTAKPKEKQYNEYSYKRLPKPLGFIRVLRLLGNGIYNAEVECELLVIAFIGDEPLDYEYEALSWCWGTSKPSGRIVIRKGGKDKKRLSKSVTPDLVAALRALRYQGRDRFLWIDQICINQENPLEKNHQVEMMSEIYGRASKVCIWLGEGDRSSRMALEFIKKEVLQLQNFDELCGSEQASEKWGALLDLMQRPWFSRRWVVQEIALAHSTVVYCGGDKISWKKFAVAVELFVEVETATHRLSEVMKKDPRFYHVPGWFEYVSALGASLLVEATGKLFRDYKPNGPIETEVDSDSEADSEEEDMDDDEAAEAALDLPHVRKTAGVSTRATNNTKRSLGQPLLTLEYLVSSLSIFEVTTPHDAIYALLAIARDTTPFADDKAGFRHQLVKTQQALEGFTQKKRYMIDYEKPFADVCKEFVTFCIEGSKDRTRALDIICRPWAPDDPNSDSKYVKKYGRGANRKAVRLESKSSRDTTANKSARSDRGKGQSRQSSGEPSQPYTLPTDSGVVNQAQKKQKWVEVADQDLPLPSWIPSLSGAAYAMYSQAGVHTLKMGRKNADTLVGLPPSNQSLERNYNAAETRGVDKKSLRFVKRPNMKHWSMFVKGFVLDKVVETQPASQGGAIPRSWATAGRWFDVPDSDPPDEFWRTLVADRGRDGKNPPVYYSRACKESFAKGGLSSGSVNMTDLINNERCSVIAQFCRRVQAVIWNRCLITTKYDRLGLTGQDVKREDLVCILYGCSVPVVLRRKHKSKEQVLHEMREDFLVSRKNIFDKYNKIKDDRKNRRMIENADRYLDKAWQMKMLKAWRKDTKGREEWIKKMQTAEISPKDSNCQRVTMEGESQPFEIVAPIGEKNIIDEILERRAYVRWKKDKRKSGEISEKGFKREDKLVFELKLRWGRRWKQIWRRRKNTSGELEQTAANAGPSLGRNHHESNLASVDEGLDGGMDKREVGGVEPFTNGDIVNGTLKEGGILIETGKASPSGAEIMELTGMNEETEHDGIGKCNENVTETPVANGGMTNGGSISTKSDQKFSVSDTGTAGTSQSNGIDMSTGDQSDDTHRDKLPDPKLQSQMDIRATSDKYIQRYVDWYLAPYKTPKEETTDDTTVKKGFKQEQISKEQAEEEHSPKAKIKTGEIENVETKHGEGIKREDIHAEDTEKHIFKNCVIDLEEPDWSKDDKGSLRIQEKWCYYQFLGESYVHGMMDGEAMAYQNENGIQAQVFELR